MFVYDIQKTLKHNNLKESQTLTETIIAIFMTKGLHRITKI